ncbi:MAG TPA: enoyl-CoA hydratase-related protein, partial [Woeseiaceae bacterium]|nr:enoyl-CoA hydratase-related protein [Woeseiaceae bacterium]
FRSVERWKVPSPERRIEVPPARAQAIRQRLLGILFSQTVDILDREIGSPADLDLGCRLAFGFRKGPLQLMAAEGEEGTGRIMARLAADRPGMPMPSRSVRRYAAFRRYVLVDRVEGICVATLRRPDALNALHDELNDEILDVIRAYENDEETLGFVITGYGVRAFSAGADIGRFPSMLGDSGAAADYARACSRVLCHLDRMEKPVVAALNGMALGGGLELAIRCHGLVAVRDAWMQFPEICLGLVPGIGALVVPYRRWPGAAAAFHAMLRRAERLDAGQAFELGILDAVVEDHDTLLHAAIDLARALGESPRRIPEQPIELAAPAEAEPASASTSAPTSTEGQPLSRRVLGIMQDAVERAAAAPSLEEALEIGYSAFGASACTAAAREGIDAFLENRKPDFTRTG